MAANNMSLLAVVGICLVLLAQPGLARPPMDQPGHTRTIRGSSSSEAHHKAPAKCPQIDHVIIAMMENRAASLLKNNATLVKNIQAVIDTYSPAMQYYGYTHDSEPNYIAMTSGTNACTHSDNDLIFTQESIFDQLSQKGKSWKCYSQSIPSPGFNGSKTDGDIYKRKHNPCAMYASTVTKADGNVGYDAFLSDLAANTLPTYSFVVPDQCHDMHGASGCNQTAAELISAGDEWTKGFWANVTNSDAWKNKNVLVAWVYDEDDYTTTTGCCGSPVTPSNGAGDAICSWNKECDGGTLAPTCPETFYQGYKVTSSGDIYGGGHTLAAFAYSQAKKRCILDYPMNHLSVLKTIQHCWDLPLLGNTVMDNVPYLNSCIFH